MYVILRASEGPHPYDSPHEGFYHFGTPTNQLFRPDYLYAYMHVVILRASGGEYPHTPLMRGPITQGLPRINFLGQITYIPICMLLY